MIQMEPIKSSATHGELIEDRIRQIVREEIAAHEERRHQEVIDFLAATAELVRGTSE
jgi:plasmid stability protein